MGWIRCIRCKQSRRDIVTRTFALIAPVQGPMGWIRCVCWEKIKCDFVAQTFALIEPVHPVLHRVSSSYEMIPNTPKHYETHQNMSLGPMEWIECICCEKLQHIFVAQTFALIAPVQLILHQVSCNKK